MSSVAVMKVRMNPNKKFTVSTADKCGIPYIPHVEVN